MAESKFKTVLRVTSGNLLEMYDFMVYGYYATAIGDAFFPSTSHYASLMATLVTFGAGFLMRPVGAVVLGAYIDHHGRRQGLIVTLGLMALGSLMIACVPGYATIGLLAPLIVLLGRLLQGFSAGVELGGVSVYLAEMATPGNRGFYVSWQSASQQAAVVAAASIGYALNHSLSKQQMGDWGWRVPFLIGCLLVPAIFLIRRNLQETDEFAARTEHPSIGRIYRSLITHKKLILTAVAMVVMSNVSFYVITAYTPTFGKELHLPDSDNLLVTMAVGFSNFLWLPIFGAVSDRIGRRPVLLLFSGLAVLTAYPAMHWLVQAPSFERLLVVELWLSFLYGSYNGAMVVALAEIMPLEVRTAGFSLAYSLSAALFGGFSLAISTYLIKVTGNQAAPGFWLMAAALSGFLATVRLFGLGPWAGTQRELSGGARP